MKKRFSGFAGCGRIAAAIALLLSCSVPLKALAQSAAPPNVTDQLIIKYRSHVALARAEASASEHTRLHRRAQDAAVRAGHRLKAVRVGALDTHVMRLDRALDTAEAQQLAREIAVADDLVEYAEPDLVMQPQFIPNDPYAPQQWHYYEPAGGINLPDAWDASTGSGVVVAVLDTGYRPHVDLKINLLPGYDFVTDLIKANDGDGRDSSALDPGDWLSAKECRIPDGGYPSSWHGTHVAGTIAAQTHNGVGVAGVAYNAKVLPVRVLGRCGGYLSDVADALIWASGGSVQGVPKNMRPAQVANLSLGEDGPCGTTMQNAINSARARGTAIVVAAGNANADVSQNTPANCSGVIAVAATNRGGGRAFYSNYGSRVALAAPGGDMLAGRDNGIGSTLNTGFHSPGDDSYDFKQGTSMAAPHVAGVAALMLSKNPTLTPDTLAAKLKSSARPFPAACSGCGAGIVDAAAAVAAAGGGPARNEVEPNDAFSKAGTLLYSASAPTPVYGTMDTADDKDYYALNVAPGATLRVRLTPNATSNYDMDLYRGSTLIAQAKAGTGLADNVIAANNSGAWATYYVVVRRVSGGTGLRSGGYKLERL